MDLGRAPEGIGLGHPADQPLDLRRNLVLPRGVAAGLPAPKEAEARPMPANDRVGLDDDECVCPAGPDLGEANPECAVSQVQTWWRCGSVEGGKLLAETKVLESELGTGAEGGAKAGEQVQKQREHGWVAHDAIARLPFLWIHAHRRETRLVDEDVAKDSPPESTYRSTQNQTTEPDPEKKNPRVTGG